MGKVIITIFLAVVFYLSSLAFIVAGLLGIYNVAVKVAELLGFTGIGKLAAAIGLFMVGYVHVDNFVGRTLLPAAKGINRLVFGEIFGVGGRRI